MSHPALRHVGGNAPHLGIMGGVNHDLVMFPASPAEAQAHTLTYHGGPTMPQPRLLLVYLNEWWGDTAKLETFARDLMGAGYLQPLADQSYGSGPGTYAGSVHLVTNLGTVLRDSAAQALLRIAITQGALPPPDDNLLYALILPAGVTGQFDDDGSQSCSSWCGYHSNFTLPDGRGVIYSVQPDTHCGPCNGGMDPFAAFTMVLSHEVAEAATDPTGQGWWDSRDGSENADIVAWIPRPYGPWTVQGYFTNQTGNTLGEYVPAPAPPPDPQPQPQPEPDCAQTVDDYLAGKIQQWARSYTKRAAAVEIRRDLAGLLQ